jgi:two-component system, NarL family, response regulator NreC
MEVTVMMPYRIILADDHVLVRQGLKRLIESAANLQVIGEANNGLEVLGLLRRLAPDLLILDISMPHLRGIETMREMKSLYPSVKSLVLTMYRDREYLFGAMSAGASGYVLKDDAETQLFAAIDKIRRGGVYVSPRLADDLVELAARGHRDGADGDRLSLREREVLKLTAEGKTSKEIAELLGISYRTVEHHRANITDKLNLKGTAELVRYAIGNGYLAAS